jgi:hypothetical protein
MSAPTVVANPNTPLGTLIIAAQLRSDSFHHVITATPSASGGLTFSAWGSSAIFAAGTFYGNGPALSITPDGSQLNFFATLINQSTWQGNVVNLTSTNNGASWGNLALLGTDIRDTPGATSPDSTHTYVIGIGSDGRPYLDPWVP